MSRKGRRQLAEYGWRPDRPNPARLLLESRDLDAARLRARLYAEQGWSA
ncbi:hypothetical protein ACWDRB_62355 [Nonomuraea sp. NPDC003707]